MKSPDTMRLEDDYRKDYYNYKTFDIHGIPCLTNRLVNQFCFLRGKSIAPESVILNLGDGLSVEREILVIRNSYVMPSLRK